MKNKEELRERLCDMVLTARRDDRLEDADALREVIHILDNARLERIAPQEDNWTLISRFVSNIGYDYIQHYKKGTAQMHPDWSEKTKILWEEIKSRMQTPKCLNFDRESALAEIDELRRHQDNILSNGSISPEASWRVGIIHGLNDARRVIEKYVVAEEGEG